MVTKSRLKLHIITPAAPNIQCESKKSPQGFCRNFSKNGWEFFDQIVHAYYVFLSTLDCEFLFKYLKL